MNKQEKRFSAWKMLGMLGTGALAAIEAWLLYSYFVVDHKLPMPPAVDSEKHFFTGRASGRLHYYLDKRGAGRPIVLLHSINAAASAYEMRPLFNHFRGSRPVYALDLPGFGFSERSDRTYSAELYATAICEFLREVVKQPAQLVALSLSGEFAALAAFEHPELVHSLTLISPTGLNTDRRQDELGNERRLVWLSFLLWSQGLFDFLTTRPVIRFFLGRNFASGRADADLADYAYQTAHRPGGRYAPLYFLSGKLFNPHILPVVYDQLTLPILVLYDRDPYTNFEALPDLLMNHANWQVARIVPSKGLPHFEQTAATGRVLDDFWHTTEPLPPIKL